MAPHIHLKLVVQVSFFFFLVNVYSNICRYCFSVSRQASAGPIFIPVASPSFHFGNRPKSSFFPLDKREVAAARFEPPNSWSPVLSADCKTTGDPQVICNVELTFLGEDYHPERPKDGPLPKYWNNEPKVDEAQNYAFHEMAMMKQEVKKHKEKVKKEQVFQNFTHLSLFSFFFVTFMSCTNTSHVINVCHQFLQYFILK